MSETEAGSLDPAVDQENSPQKAPTKESGISRRTLCLGIGASVVMLGLGAVNLVPAQALVRPPGAQDEAALLGGCIRCGRCMEVCPRHVIVMQHMEDGILGARTPVMSFKTDYCTGCVEENGGVPLCAVACPTDAISVAPGVDPTKIVIGLADIETEQCLAYRFAGCKFCYDACPDDAIEMIAGKPHVIADRCNGCGACESVCVSLKEGSIHTGAKRRAIAVIPASGKEGGTR